MRASLLLATRRAARSVLLTVALLAALPAMGHAHGALRRSEPERGAHLSVAPRQLRLTFSEPVELAIARLQLISPDSASLTLGALRLAPDSATVLIADIAGGLVAGRYTVRWQVVGTDGHPVRGDFTFVIAPGAQGLVQPSAAVQEPPPPAHHDVTSLPTGPGFDAGSPLYAAVRWVNFLGLLGIIGAVAFRLVVVPLWGRQDGSAAAPLVRPAGERAARLGLVFATLLVLAALLRLYAQSYALHGAADAVDSELLGSMLTRTTWGWGWLLQILATSVALLGFATARRDGRAGWALAGLGALALGFTPGLSGHAASVASLAPVAVLSDALHVLGAGGWLGGLLCVVAVGIPVAARVGENRVAAVAALARAFSPVALLFAGVVVATGVFAGWLHLESTAALWGSEYGRVLLLKLAVLLGVFGTGLYNWRRVVPALGDEAGTRRLRRSATFELGIGVVVLAVTAVLVATATP